MKQYCNVARYKNQIFVRELVEGVEQRRKVKFRPSLFQSTTEKTDWQNFYGDGYVERRTFDSPFEMKNFVEEFKSIPNEVWGNTDIVSQFIYEGGYDTTDAQNIKVSYLDIEVCTREKINGQWIDGGFPDAQNASFPINAICDYRPYKKKYYVFTTAKGWTPKKSQLKYADEVEYIYCPSEDVLIEKWMRFWESDYPHIVTGWNCLDKKSNLWTADKIITFDDVVAGQKLVDSIVKRRFPESRKTGYRLNLQNGQSIIASKDHIFPIYSKLPDEYTKFTKKTPFDMTVGDILADTEHEHFCIVPKHNNTNKDMTYRDLLIENKQNILSHPNIAVDFNDIETKEDCVITIKNAHQRTFVINLNEVIDIDTLHTLGLLYTDGTFDRNRTTYVFSNTHMELMEAFADVLDTYKLPDKMKPRAFCLIEHKHGNCYQYKISANNPFGLFSSLFIYDNGKKKLNVKNLSMLSHKQFMAFLGGVFDGDGCVCNDTVGIVNYENNGLDARNLQELCLWNGVCCSVKNNHINFYQSSFGVLQDSMLLKHDMKKSRLAELKPVERKNTSSKKINIRELDNCYIIKLDSIEELEEDYEMLDIETNTHYFYANGMKVHNCKSFDIPYIINRLKRLKGEEFANRISPWRVLTEKKSVGKFGQDIISYEILGIGIVDYLDLYQKYRYVPREKYTLDYISRCELPDEHKLEFKGTHGSLYYDDPVFFVDYNIQDVRCVVKFEEKLQFMNLIIFLSYYSGINFEENFSPIKIWETLIYRTAADKGIVIPMKPENVAKEPYEGAYVHDPVPGLKGCIVSLDATSLYPSIMRLYYIAPDSHQTGQKKARLYTELMDVLRNDGSEEATEMFKEIVETGIFNKFYIKNDMPKSVVKFLKENKVSLTTNCEFYNIERESIFIRLIADLFAGRKSDKKTSFNYKHKAQDIEHELEKRGTFPEYANLSVEELEIQHKEAKHLANVYDVSQLVKKILLD